MLPFAALPVLAAVTVLLAVGMASWRRKGSGTTVREFSTAFVCSLAGMGLAVCAYALGRSAEAIAWRNSGAACLAAAPVICAVALRWRHRLPLLRGLVGGGLAAGLVFAWLVLSLRGPGGGWEIGLLSIGGLSAALAVAAGVCGAAWTRRYVAVGLLVAILGSGVACTRPPAGEIGRVSLEVRDDVGTSVPARVEIRDANGKSWIPDAALEIAGDCGIVPAHNWFPALAPTQVERRRERSVTNPFRQTEQFYVSEDIEARLPPGRYVVRATRGPEFEVARQEIVVAAGTQVRARLQPRRWIDLPAQGWYGADDHLHIPRPDPSFDEAIASWMAAEGLQVANLLQMGLARDVHITPQHAFGAVGAVSHGGTLLVSGQENPRTHVLGHAITLGAPRWIDYPADYLLYPRFWSRAHDLGAANGLAHFGLGGAEKALALWADSGLIDFLEVENFGFAIYDRWYESLNLGLRLTPTAGSDYPCVPNLPGRDRFYARVDGEFSFEGWLDAVRAGRTFVTNGPMIEFTVAGRLVASEIDLAAPGTVRVEGRVRFDPGRDRVTVLELIEKGQVAHAREHSGSPGLIEFAIDWPIEETTWLALRARGAKVGEVRPPGLEQLASALDYPAPHPGRERQALELPGEDDAPVSAAHTAPVWIHLDSSPPLFAQESARFAAEAWAARLADLEYWLSDQALPEVAGYPGRGDGVEARLLRTHRRELLRAVKESRAWLARAGSTAQPK